MNDGNEIKSRKICLTFNESKTKNDSSSLCWTFCVVDSAWKCLICKCNKKKLRHIDDKFSPSRAHFKWHYQFVILWNTKQNSKPSVTLACLMWVFLLRRFFIIRCISYFFYSIESPLFKVVESWSLFKGLNDHFYYW